MIKNLIINEISKATIYITMNSINNVNNYINLIKSFDEIVNKGIILAIKSYLEDLDYNYTNSIERKINIILKIIFLELFLLSLRNLLLSDISLKVN